MALIIHKCGCEIDVPDEGEDLLICPRCDRPVLPMPPPHLTHAAQRIGSITGLQVDLMHVVTRAYYQGWDDAMARCITNEINADPEEVQRLRQSREQAAEGRRAPPEEFDDGAVRARHITHHPRNTDCSHPERQWISDPVYGSCGEGHWVCPGHDEGPTDPEEVQRQRSCEQALGIVRHDLDRAQGILTEVQQNLARFLGIEDDVAANMSIVDLVTEVRVLKQEHDACKARGPRAS